NPTGEIQSSALVTNRYTKIKYTILTEAVFAPGSIPLAPIAMVIIPTANKIIPMAYFIFADGLYLLSHHFENRGAKAIMYKEFNDENQDAGTSKASSAN